jgi:hypothetical protein
MRLKHDIVLLGRLDDGLGYYRFVYNGGHTAYVGVMAQEVRTVMPEAVTRGVDGYMRVSSGCIRTTWRRLADRGPDRRGRRRLGRGLRPQFPEPDVRIGLSRRRRQRPPSEGSTRYGYRLPQALRRWVGSVSE